MNHITLTTGHIRRSPRAEVDDATLAVLSPWIAANINSGVIVPLPAASLSHYAAKLINEVGLVTTVYAPLGPHVAGQPHTGRFAPLVTFGVAQRSRESKPLWDMLVHAFGVKGNIKAPPCRGAPSRCIRQSALFRRRLIGWAILSGVLPGRGSRAIRH